jgi:hypothetical protein
MNPTFNIVFNPPPVTRHSGIATFQNPKSIEASTLRLP